MQTYQVKSVDNDVKNTLQPLKAKCKLSKSTERGDILSQHCIKSECSVSPIQKHIKFFLVASFLDYSLC